MDREIMIKQMMERTGLTTEELSVLFMVSPSQIARWKSGSNDMHPDYVSLLKIMDDNNLSFDCKTLEFYQRLKVGSLEARMEINARQRALANAEALGKFFENNR